MKEFCTQHTLSIGTINYISSRASRLQNGIIKMFPCVFLNLRQILIKKFPSIVFFKFLESYNYKQQGLQGSKFHLSVSPGQVNEDVKQIFGKLKTSKSPGPDGLHPRVHVELTDQLIEPLKTIFCRSLIEGQLPQDWKDGNITPIFKKGKRHIPGNYRPVSLTSIPCKMLERLVRNAIMEHMESNHLLNDVQHGFVPGRSCSTQLLTVLDDWTSALEDGDNLDAIYMDFAKAFDTVPHQRLLVKLKGYGIGGAVLQWIDAFLSGRRQRVVVNGSKSTWAKVTSGIPQGSVLGPLLFVCFINDMPSVVKSPVHLFADDTKLYRRVTTRRAYTFLDGPTLTKLYTSLIRPLLEYSNVAWTPVLKRDQLLLENVQRRATKLVPSLKNDSYEDRLRILNLPSLYYRRARGDMIETRKYLHGQYHVNQMPLQRDTNTTTSGHSMKLRKERCLKRQRRNFFRHRVVNRWNMLTDNIVNIVPSVNIFKNRLDAFRHVHKCEQSDDFPCTCTNTRQDQLTGY